MYIIHFITVALNQAVDVVVRIPTLTKKIPRRLEENLPAVSEPFAQVFHVEVVRPDPDRHDVLLYVDAMERMGLMKDVRYLCYKLGDAFDAVEAVVVCAMESGGKGNLSAVI